MNGSWSDQDLSRESDLTEPDSQSGMSEGEFESFEDAGHRTEEHNMKYKDQTENGNAVDLDGLPDNHDQSTEGEEEDDISYNSSEHHHPEVVGGDEAEGPPEGRLEDSGETMGGGEPVVNEKQQTVINMHHVDLILDNIDAELNDIINRSLNSEHSEHSYHGNSSSSGTSRHSQKASTLTRQGPESSNNATADETLEDDSASDTGLGTGSHRGDSSPIPNGDHVRHGSAVGKIYMNGEGKGTKLKNGSNRSFKKKVSKRQALVEFSDGDSICSDDVRMRMEETLNLQDSDTDALPSQHSHNPSHTHDALQKHNRSLPSSATASNSTKSWNRRRGVPDEANDNRTEDSSQSDDNHETQDISSRIQEMVSLVLSDSTTDPLFDEASSPNLSNNHQSQNLPRTNHNTQRTTGAIRSSENGRTHQSLPPDSKSFLEHRRAGRGIDADSIATEDFEHVFQTSIVTHDPPSTTSRSPLKTTRNNPSNRNEAKRIPSASPKKTDHLTVPGMGKRGKSRSKKKRTNTLPTSKPSGLPEYMYLRKGVTESDVGSDSIRTEDYEGHFEVARVTDQHNSPKYANFSNIPRSRHAPNVQSDPESIQTEEYEQRFRSLMVKQVAGVPVKSFDQVTIASDLESVETGMVHEKFQEALRKGPEVRVFNEFGDQSDLDPLQMEEVERKFQKILRKKKIEKMRHSKKDGDTEDDVTSDMDSVRAIPSKSETSSPPNRQSKNGRSKGHRHHNGVQVKHSGRSRDASPRTNTYNTTRSSPRGAPSSPWSTPRDVSPSPPQKSPTAVATAVNFPFNYHPPAVARSCGNHHDKNPASTLSVQCNIFKERKKILLSHECLFLFFLLCVSRTEQANFPSWQDPSVGRQRAAAWNSQRQDSFSTYEEVESLHSHQCSSLQSLDNSCGPSRLQSFGSTSSSLDQSHPQVDGGPWASGIPAEDHLFDHEQDDQGSSLTSDSTQSASAKGGRSGHLKEKSRRSLIEDDEDEMNSSVAKWVDQTRAETARRRSYVGLPEDPLVRSHEAPEGGQHSCDLNKERSLTALKMQCGDVIPGKSGRQIRLPNETDLELALRVGNSSPVSMISRCASLDSSHGSPGSDHPEGDWTIAEDVLINLGFGGANMGIPSRFLKSWREQVLKQRVEEVRRLLGNTTSNHLLQHLPTKPEKTHSPKEKIPLPRKEDRHNHNLPSTSTYSPRSSSTSSLVSDSSNSQQVEDAVMSRQRGADKAKLVGLRRSLKKAATVSSFGQTLSEISNSRQGPPNQQIVALQQGDQPPAARRSPGGGKYSPFHKSHKSSARDRRRKYMKKQSSLPISLETLQEEDESLKPGLVKSKQADTESPSARKNLLKPQSLEVGDQPAFHCKLKIVMEQPSVESREAMSRQGTTDVDVDVDEAIADVDTDKKDQKVSMEQYLVVKAIIDSKDSGFENEPSRTGSPQISPRSSEDETVKGTCSKTITTADFNAQRTRSSEIPDSKTDNLLVIVPSKENNDISGASPSTCPDENFQGQHIKQEQSPKREELPSTESKSTSETSRLADVTIVPVPQTKDTKLSGCSSSTSSDRRRPSLADIQDDFHQTITEEDNDVFDSPVGGHISDSVSACCQTSPSLHSPLLSPLFFLGSISEHPDSLSDGNNSATNVSPEIFVLPSGSASDVGYEKGGVSAERHDSLESVKTTADGLVSDSSLRSLSQEISDGGLSIIAEKDEEQGFGQEPSDRISVMDKAIQDSQELLSPLSMINNKTSGISGQNRFQFDDLPQNSEPLDPTTSNPVEKSRNPFKSSDSFYSSPRHSKVDFDFDATIEEDEDGEQYSDGESFSKVAFPELTAMVYKASNLANTSASDHLNDNSEESHNSSPCLSKDDHGPEMHCSELDETDFKTDISSESARNKSGTDVNSTGSWDNEVQNGTNSGRTGLDHNDCKENSRSVAQSDTIIFSKQPISENYILNKAGDETAPAISVIDGKESEEKPTGYEKNAAGCQHDDCRGNCQNRTSLRTDELTKDSVPVNHPGDHSQFSSNGQFINEQAAYDNQASANNPDGEIPPGGSIPSENVKMSDLELGNGSRQTDKANFTSEVKSSFFAWESTKKHTEFLDRLHSERNGMEEWKLGFDQPQIIRSTSVEAHLNFQRRKLRTLSERSTLYSDGMEPLLSGFGRIITERSSSSTEGFGSFGSDIFRRPQTTMQTLQQVAAKLESHIRQRSLVSIQDDESEEENEQRVAEEPQSPYKQTVPEVEKLADLDSTEERNSVQPDENGKCKLHEDERYKDVNSRDENDIAVHPVDKSTTDTSKSAKVCEEEVTNNSNLCEENLQHDENTVATSDNVDALEVETKVISPNIHVDGTSDYKPLSKSDVQNMSASTHENCTGANKDTPSATTAARRRSWQFQATASRKSRNFLSVPSFGPLTDTFNGNPFSASLSAKQVNPNVGVLQEVVPDLEHHCDSADSQSLSKLSELSDETDSLQIKDFEASCKIIMEHVVDEKDQDGEDEFSFDLCTGIETSCTECEVSNLTEPGTMVEFKGKDPVLEQTPKSVVVSFDHLEDSAPSENERGSHCVLDKIGIPSYPMLVYPTSSSVSEVKYNQELPKLTSDFVYVKLLPTNGPNVAHGSAVVHSQYYRCEKFVNVSTSSDGKVAFIETGEDDNLCASHQLPTFLSEVNFPALSNARKGFSSQPAENRMSISSQGSRSLDCPSPVPSSRLSPTFEEICTKAGNLMQQLQEALGSESPEDLQRSQVEIENKNTDKELDELHQEEEEEGGFIRYTLLDKDIFGGVSRLFSQM
ncbi:uncharacterized protein LOC119730104 [Patiria miniata]|uniref:Uncharacterized protein n=1 Tax=Patiria miniata TaxID=46514 RepID=A0A914A521_PATMI|nr:uncharacterized protein LOC119730104 [Patiria miniata]